MDADPLASLRVAELVVPFAGIEHTIPAYPAAKWLEVLFAQPLDLEAVFPGLAGLDAELAVNTALVDGAATQEDLEQIIYEVLEAVSGRRWWVALRLCLTVRAHWEWVGGAMARSGLTPFDVPLGFWLDGAYATMVHEMASNASTEDDLRKIADWSHALTTPPVSQIRKEADDVMDRDAFLALARAHGRF
jgi:hypothetical protein